jgi:hypothetical protein
MRTICCTGGGRTVLPVVLESDLDDDPPWVIFEALPGVPVPEADEVGPGGSRFPERADRLHATLL